VNTHPPPAFLRLDRRQESPPVGAGHPGETSAEEMNVDKKTTGKNKANRGRKRRKRRYEMLWRNKFLTVDAKSVAEMADILRGAANYLREMADAGVVLDPDGVVDDYANLTTTDPEVAERFGFDLTEDDE
jgi:hypothetical protein